MRMVGCLVVVALGFPALVWGQGRPACRTIRGRAHLYTGDGQLRIWQVGTRHDFQPDESTWARVQGWLGEGATQAQKEREPETYAGEVNLFGDFLVCPVERYRKGAVQTAEIRSVRNRRYTAAD